MRYWVNGRLVDSDEAHVDVLDHGFTVGDGVFETLKAVADPGGGAAPFAMDRHVARLVGSARGMGIAGPSVAELRQALLAVCDANPQLAAGGRIRVTLTSGPGPLGSDRVATAPTLVVTSAPSIGWPATTSLALSPWPRNERSPLAGLKTTSYGENVLALARAKAVGAGEALLGNLAGDLCEGTGSNVFVVRDGQVRTPSLRSGCLAGITRALVLDWWQDAVEADEPLALIRTADEVFVTSSTRDVHPVARILDEAGDPIWEATAWPVTDRVASVFAQRAAESWNP